MSAAGWITLALSLMLGLACIAGAVALARAERRVRRIQLPARLIDKTWLPPGYVLTVEFPGPDGAPRRTTVMSAYRRGLGATPVFQGWVWVAADDPSDVVVRPRARMFWPVFLSVAGSVILVAGLMATVILWAVGTLDALPAG